MPRYSPRGSAPRRRLKLNLFSRRKRRRRAVTPEARKQRYIRPPKQQPLPNKLNKRAKRYFRSGILIAASFLLVFFGYIFYELYNIQVVNHRVYAEEAANQHMRRQITYPPRGSILSANGETLAMTTYVYSIGITPSHVRSRIRGDAAPAKEEIAAEVARILDLEEASVFRAMSQTERVYVPLKNQVLRSTYDELRAYLNEKRIGGFAIDHSMQRFYPQESLASQVVGFASKITDNLDGVTGVEASYDSALAGSPGYSYSELDNLSGVHLPNSQQASVSEVAAQNLVLTIDTRVQRIVEHYAAWAQDTFRPQEGLSVIVMDPHTGAVLGMAGGNNYDLNQPAAAPDGFDPETWNPNTNEEHMEYMLSRVWSNYSIQTSYEPGSTMKVFTAAMAVEEDVYQPGEKLSDEPIWVEGWTAYPISSSVQVDMTHVTLAEALRHSLNPPFVILAQRMGVPTFYDYVHRLGFRQRTGIDLPGEGNSQVHSNPQVIDMATFSFGEQSTVTPIQLANGYAAIANGGELMVPHVGLRLEDRDGNPVRDLRPDPVRRVLSEETAAAIREMMTGVPAYGTGTEIYIPGYRVAAKTGTSTHGPNDDKRMITVGSITPADDPKYVILTSLFVPELQEGSWPTQVLNRKISEEIGPLLGVVPEYNEYDLTRLFTSQSLNRIVGEDLRYGKRIATLLGYALTFEEGMSDESPVTAQYPPAGSPFGYYGTYWVSESGALPEEFVEVPDFTGMTFEEVFEAAKKAGVNARLMGGNRMGVVTSQNMTANMDYELMNPSAEDIDPAVTTEGIRVRRHSLIDVHFDGTGQEGPKNDGSIIDGMKIPER